MNKDTTVILFENINPDRNGIGALRISEKGIQVSRQRNADNTDWLWEQVETIDQEENRMIKLKDAVKKYGDYEIDEKKLENILVKPKPKTVWDLKIGDIYYFVDSRGRVIQSTWDNDEADNQRLIFGNIFLTSKEAEFEAERRKVEAEMLKLGGTRDMMSLGNVTCKYYMKCCYNGIVIDCRYDTNYQGSIYFKTKEDCKNVIDKIGEDRIKKYIFNVKE